MRNALGSVLVLAVGFVLGATFGNVSAQDTGGETGPAAGEVEQAKAAEELAKAKEKAARRLMDASNAGDYGKQVMDQMTEGFEQSPFLPPGFVEKFREMVTIEELVDMVVPIYVKHFDLEEMDAAIEYWESPVGMSVSKKMPAAMKEAMAVGQEWGEKMAMKVMAELNK